MSITVFQKKESYATRPENTKQMVFLNKIGSFSPYAYPSL